jgi:hypothetical protein
MAIKRIGRTLSLLGVLFLAGCVTISPTATPNPRPTPTLAPTPTLLTSAAPTLPPTAPPTIPPTHPRTAPPTSEPTAQATAEPTPDSTATQLDPNQRARYGSLDPLDFAEPDQSDPMAVSVSSGGPVDASYLGDDCAGFAEPNPDYEVHYSAGEQGLLRFYFVADSPGDDATLIVNDVDGKWHCSDDDYGSSNPSIDFAPPESGWYDIWIGSYSAADYISGTLYMTELNSNHP